MGKFKKVIAPKPFRSIGKKKFSFIVKPDMKGVKQVDIRSRAFRT